MTWQMNVDSLGNIGLSALVAAIPIFFLFWALAIKRMKGQFAAMGGTGLAILIAVFVYKMPVDLAALATLYGGAFGLFPVCWIVITALFIYNMSVKTGQFEVIKNSLASISMTASGVFCTCSASFCCELRICSSLSLRSMAVTKISATTCARALSSAVQLFGALRFSIVR